MQSVGEVMAIGRTFEVGLRTSFLRLIRGSFVLRFASISPNQRLKKGWVLLLGWLSLLYYLAPPPQKNLPKSRQVGEISSVA